MDFRGLFVLISQILDPGVLDFNRFWMSILMALLVILLCLSFEQGAIPTILSLISCNFFWSLKKRKCMTEDDLPEKEKIVPDSPTVTERPKKFCRKLKKKKNSLSKSKYKIMDDANDGCRNDGGQRVELYPVQERTKVYTPLKLFLDLNMEIYPLYHEFKPHVLTKKHMQMYGFPLESPENPGRISPDPKALKSDDPNKRHCCRCEGLFYVLPDGQYHCDSSCHYHAKKRLPYRGIPGAGAYPCCNGDYLSEGCEKWPYHVSAESFLQDVEFVKARGKRHLTENKSCTVYALDCEMCYTTGGMEVTKVGIVGVDGLTLYESFVLPEKQVLDYNTIYSGVTANDLNGVITTLTDVQAYILKLINKDTILVGHGLENDLRALRLIHENVVDTSVVFPHKHGQRYKRSLKSLAEEFLNKPIQEGSNGHDCIEDARTCMELMLYKIHLDLKSRAPLIQDENKNSIIQNTPNSYGHLQTTWSCFTGNSNGNQISRFYSDFCTRRVVY